MTYGGVGGGELLLVCCENGTAALSSVQRGLALDDRLTRSGGATAGARRHYPTARFLRGKTPLRPHCVMDYRGGAPGRLEDRFEAASVAVFDDVWSAGKLHLILI